MPFVGERRRRSKVVNVRKQNSGEVETEQCHGTLISIFATSRGLYSRCGEALTSSMYVRSTSVYIAVVIFVVLGPKMHGMNQLRSHTVSREGTVLYIY
jgi:hypothetical protein